MRIDITWRTTVLALIGLVATATVGINASAARGGVAHSAAVAGVDCNVHDPFSPCFAANLGYPAGDLFVEYYH
jgi:hypothetical protein